MAAVGCMCSAAAHDLLGQFALREGEKSHTSRTLAMLRSPDHRQRLVVAAAAAGQHGRNRSCRCFPFNDVPYHTSETM